MDEKEFLKQYSIFIGTTADGTMRDDCIDQYLIQHHKTYKSVYWYKWHDKEKDIIKQQVRIKLRDFLINQFDFLDYDWMDKKIDEYIERNFNDK